MTKPKMISIQRKVAKQLVRILDKLEEQSCIGCPGTFHTGDCPALEAYQLRKYLTQRVNNPQRNFTI
jgi:heterodisulfide reductase subunit B